MNSRNLQLIELKDTIAVPTLTIDSLNETIASLKNTIENLKGDNAALKESNAKQAEMIEYLNKKLFGRKSEKTECPDRWTFSHMQE